MTHGGAATLCRPVLLYILVMATKHCACGMIIKDHRNATWEHRRSQKHRTHLEAKMNKRKASCRCIALTTRSLSIPGILCIKDHVQTEG